uniref:Uncharacterized protein n=1 Tax=Panagrolaimus davidi TaxID=227884 RepID=A0A914QWS1_9BILA
MPGMRVKIATGVTYLLPRVDLRCLDAAKTHYMQIKAGKKFRKEVRKIVGLDKTYRQNIAKYPQNKGNDTTTTGNSISV